MSYHVVDPDSIEPREGIPGAHRYLNDAVDLEEMAVQVIEAEPGEDVAPFHYHAESDEVFYVLEGTLNAEGSDDEFTIESGNWFFIKSGNPIHVFNADDASETLRALLLNLDVDDFTLWSADDDE
jgi:uncharacterized cupin superfamily protein